MGRPRKNIPSVESTQEHATEQVTSPDLVAVQKGEEALMVHRTCVKAHVDMGWKVKE